MYRSCAKKEVVGSRALVMRRLSSQRAFSLIELLVVMATIALLLSIMLPALQRSIRQARSTVCMHNLRAIDQVVQIYRLEHKGWLPHLRRSNVEVPTQATLPWFDMLVPHYLKDLDILVCPDDPHRSILKGAALSKSPLGWSNASSYGMNAFILRSNEFGSRTSSAYLANVDRYPPRRLQDTLLLADMGPDYPETAPITGTTFRAPIRNGSVLSWSDAASYTEVEKRNPWLTRRHGKSINALTLGGSVRPIATAELMNKTPMEYYPSCAAGGCTFCTDLCGQQLGAHYSFAHNQTYWWTGPVPTP